MRETEDLLKRVVLKRVVFLDIFERKSAFDTTK